jgi:hypothetical protein
MIAAVHHFMLHLQAAEYSKMAHADDRKAAWRKRAKNKEQVDLPLIQISSIQALEVYKLEVPKWRAV